MSINVLAGDFGAATACAFIVLGVSCTGLDGKTGPAGTPGANGTPGSDGSNGAVGSDGKNGTVPALVGGLQGTVSVGGSPVKGVAVTGDPAALATTTDATGAFTFGDVAIGAYTLTFTKAGYVDKTVSGVSVAQGVSTKLAVTLDVSPTADVAPTVTVTDVPNAGFGAPVSLTATVTDPDSDVSKATYSWQQIAGPTVALTGANGPTISFTTPSFAVAMATSIPNARFGVLGVDPQQAGQSTFEVTVTDAQGRATTADVNVASTAVAPGVRAVPVGIPVWFQGDAAFVTPKQTSWSWSVQGPAGSAAAFADASSEFPSLTPDKGGDYTVTEAVSGKSLILYAAFWYGIMGDASQAICKTCHNGSVAADQFAEWQGTKHYSALQRELDGLASPTFGPTCLSCHTVGDSPLAANGGFDDEAKTSGWTFPAALAPGAWSTLENNAGVGKLAGIQCENCHGPQLADSHPPPVSPSDPTLHEKLSSRISWSADVCASCHEQEPKYYAPGQWASAKHANLGAAIAYATVEGQPGGGASDCGRCHAAQGFEPYVGQLALGVTGPLTTDGLALNAGKTNAATDTWLRALGLNAGEVQPQTCAACHDPHSAANPSQLRIYDTVAALPNGMGQITGAGAGLICMTCHNTRSGEHSDFVAAPTSYAAPHGAAQTDVVFGFNAYFMPRYSPSPHLAVKDACVGCHYGSPTGANAAAKQTSNHAFKTDETICASCHSPAVDGKALMGANGASLASLGATLSGHVGGAIQAALTANASFAVRAWDPVTGYSSSVQGANVALTAAPSSIAPALVGRDVGFVLHMPAAVSIPWVDGAGNAVAATSVSDVYVSLGSLEAGSAPAPMFAAGSTLAKAGWNYNLLLADTTKGVHNPSFFSAVIAATSAQLATVTP